MSKSLYLECGSGISGDMTVAALLDLGADQEVLEKALESLQLPGYKTAVTRVKKSGLDACDFNVILDAEHENHDHDMAYLHGDMAKAHGHGEEHPAHEQEHTHDHDHNQEHPHDHNHTHTHDHAYSHDHAHAGEHHHHHEHRGLPEILTIIRRGDLTPGARALAERIFQILAEAEAKAHGVPLDQVHFHEVGAVDSIVDCCRRRLPGQPGAGRGDCDGALRGKRFYPMPAWTDPGSGTGRFKYRADARPDAYSDRNQGRACYTDRCSHCCSDPHKGETSVFLQMHKNRSWSRKTDV